MQCYRYLTVKRFVVEYNNYSKSKRVRKVTMNDSIFSTSLSDGLNIDSIIILNIDCVYMNYLILFTYILIDHQIALLYYHFHILFSIY
jgi:hypothetical protein